MSETPLLQLTSRGIYCEPGDFYIDPWQAVDRAVVTHGHSDHARWGSRHYLGTREGERVFRTRLGDDINLQTLEYGEPVTLNGVRLSLHPAGHILGSAQVRVEYRGEIYVASGDYKTDPDPTCTPFELVRCHTFITESTFGLPIYRWCPQAEIYAEINAWWLANQQMKKTSVLFAYALGKAQRLLAGLDPSIGPIYTHGAVERINRDYRDTGVLLPDTEHAGPAERGKDWSTSIVVAPVSAQGTPWMRKFGTVSTGMASGWMQIRGARRRRSVDRGFVLSDHVDWPNLMRVVRETGAEQVWVTHGYSPVVVRWLREQGLKARVLETPYEGEPMADEAAPDEAAAE